MSKRSNRFLPVEQWPECKDILRRLQIQPQPQPVRCVAQLVGAPEISTRNRLLRLEAVGAVRAEFRQTVLPSGKHVQCAHYLVTQYGRDCISRKESSEVSTALRCANSVFALGSALALASSGSTH